MDLNRNFLNLPRGWSWRMSKTVRVSWAGVASRGCRRAPTMTLSESLDCVELDGARLPLAMSHLLWSNSSTVPASAPRPPATFGYSAPSIQTREFSL